MSRRERLTVRIRREEIREAVAGLGRRISADYEGRELVMVGVLKGAFIFMADLVREITRPVICDFIGVSSYGDGTVTTGAVRLTHDLSLDIRDRHVLLVEDIIDTGLTTRYLLDLLAARQPASLRLCALLDKRGRRIVAVPVDYVGFTIPDCFVVGYGLDCDGRYRNIPDVADLDCLEE